MLFSDVTEKKMKILSDFIQSGFMLSMRRCGIVGIVSTELARRNTMKKTLVKSLAVTGLVLALGAGPLFAESGKEPSRPSVPAQKIERPRRAELPVQKGKRAVAPVPAGRPLPQRSGFAPAAPAGKSLPKRNGFAPARKPDLMGTVSAVSQDNKILTVKDADGKETQVHVNPFTRFVTLGDKAKKSALSDVQAGDWVVVSRFKGETKTMEASRIVLAREKEPRQ